MSITTVRLVPRTWVPDMITGQIRLNEMDDTKPLEWKHQNRGSQASALYTHPSLDALQTLRQTILNFLLHSRIIGWETHDIPQQGYL